MTRVVAMLLVAACGTIVVVLLLDGRAPGGSSTGQRSSASDHLPARAVGTSGSRAATRATEAAAIATLRRRDLLVPIEGADIERWKGEFDQQRESHRHEAVDIPAPRNTPVHAADAGVLAKLFVSKAGGLTVYERDPSGEFMYYYAHLERYADVREGQVVSRGDVIGYVGTSGNAPPDAPHLHFAIFVLGDPARWWEGTAIDPYLVYEGSR